MKSKSHVGAGWAGAVLCFYIFLLFGVPVYTTNLIFKHDLWVAKVLIYLVSAMAIAYSIKIYKVDLWIYRWVKKRFGVRIY